jgi:hypothetical protein
MSPAGIAARNNADLYEAVFEAHGIGFERGPFAFTATGDPPPYYSDMTVTEPGHGPEIARMVAERMRPGFGVKDSFGEIDAERQGLRVLFAASWLLRSPDAARPAPGWRRVKEARDLARWEAAWKADGSPTERLMFPERMLRRDDLAFLMRGDGSPPVGCLANRSEGAVGLSNVFGAADPEAFCEAADAVAATAPGLPVVGYEWGGTLTAARAAGFDETARLRVLVSCPASPEAP